MPPLFLNIPAWTLPIILDDGDQIDMPTEGGGMEKLTGHHTNIGYAHVTTLLPVRALEKPIDIYLAITVLL